MTIITASCSWLLVVGVAVAQSTAPPVPLAPAGETGRRITEDGLFANYFPAARKAPAVLVLGGSVGGLSLDMNNAAKALQAEGFSTLHLSYHRAPGQNERLERAGQNLCGAGRRNVERAPLDLQSARLSAGARLTT